MSDKINREYFPPGAPAFNYNATGGADSASGGSGGSGMECMQLRSPPGPFHYLISEQAKSLVALQELQNEVGALLEFRDLVIETFPNLRSKMAPSTPASGTRRDWEPGVQVRRKLAAGSNESTRAKPQPSVQDSGFSTETSCSKDAHSSASAPSASRSRPVEDELWALLDVIQRKGSRLRDEAELLRGELDERQSETAEESFARQLSAGCDADVVRLRSERDALLARAAQLEALAATSPPPVLSTPLGRLDSTLETPHTPPTVATPDAKKFTAILQERNPVELRRQLLISTVQNQVYSEQLKRADEQHAILLEKLERVTEHNDDLKFRLDEKSAELDSVKSKLQKGSSESLDCREHNSMRDMEPLNMPDEEAKISETPRCKPSKIPLHTAHKGAAPRPPLTALSRPSSSHSTRSVRSTTSARSRTSRDTSTARKEHKSAVPVRRTPENKRQDVHVEVTSEADLYRDSLDARRLETGTKLITEYLARTDRLAPLFPKLHTVRTRPLPENLLQDCRLAYETPQNLALELSKSILYDNTDSIDLKTLKSLNSTDASLWDGKPQQYFESMNVNENMREFDDDSLAS